MIFLRSLSTVVMSQIKLVPTPSWLVYFVLKAQPFFINFGINVTRHNKNQDKNILVNQNVVIRNVVGAFGV
jgi:hypothetical protein